MLTRETANLRGWLLLAMLTSSLAVAALLSLSKITLDYGSFRPTATSLGLLILTAIICAKRGFTRWSLVMEILSIGVALSVIGLIASYLATSLSLPLADELLVAADQALGFNGAAFILWIDSDPWLAWLLMQAYASFAFQLVLLPLILVLCGQQARAYGLVLSYALVCFAACLISIWCNGPINLRTRSPT